MTEGTVPYEPFNDPQPPDDSKPFYHIEEELPSVRNKEGQDMLFEDKPQRIVARQGASWKGSFL